MQGSLEQVAVFDSEHEFLTWLEGAEGLRSISWLGNSGLVTFLNGWFVRVMVKAL